jgi:hypothetical protein
MTVSSYQQAILQEMGIPVWESQQAYLDKTTSSPEASSPSHHASPSGKSISQQDKQSHLAQLRAQVGAKEVKDAKESMSRNGATVKGGGQTFKPHDTLSTSPTSQHSSTVESQPPPLGIPLSAQQKIAAKQWLSDVTLACVQLGLSSSQANVIIGKDIAVVENAIVLPVAPNQLSNKQQRGLWHALVKASQDAKKT